MLFAAKIQGGKADHIKAHLSGTLVLTNFTLEEGSPTASIYLHTPKDHLILIVTLSKATLTAYHTQLRIDLSPNTKQVLSAKNGNVHILGHFIPHDLSKEISSIDEAISIKTKEEVKESKPQAEPIKLPEQESNKTELKEKDEEADTTPRRSLRVRTPAPPPKQSSKPKKQIKFNSDSKGKKSLLEMMYTLNDNDEDDESEYSEEEEQSSSSSSSSSEEENDEDQTPKASAMKKEQKSQKIQRKKDGNRPAKEEKEEQQPDKMPVDAPQIPAATSAPTPSEERTNLQEIDNQNIKVIRVDEEVEKEIFIRTDLLSQALMINLLKNLPPKPTQATAQTIPDKDNDAGKTYKEIWLQNYRQIVNIYEKRAIRLLMDTEEARQKEYLMEVCKLQAELKSIKATLMNTRKEIGKLAQQQKTLKEKIDKSQENGFQYRIPSSIPTFALHK